MGRQRVGAIVGVGVTLAVVLLLLGRTGNDPGGGVGSIPGSAAGPVGTSMLSHGGPAATAGTGSRSGPMVHAVVTRPPGQPVETSAVHLLVRPRPAATASATALPEAADRGMVAFGTEVILDDIVGADTESAERFHHVRLPDGRTGWLPARTLQPKPRSGPTMTQETAR